jgi:hypothetical protein
MNSEFYIIELTIFLVLIYFIDYLNINKEIISLYKNPIFKIIFLFGLYTFGNNNIYLTLFLAFYYIYLGQKIQEKELLFKI